jgi:tetratricopeptide (TPR) repeat protein
MSGTHERMITAGQRGSGWIRIAIVPSMALGMLVSLPGCRSDRHAPGALDARSIAEAATRDGDWQVAASRWHDVYLSEGQNAPQPCIETARALLQLGDATSAINMVQVGLDHHPDHPDLLELRSQALVALGFRRAAEECYEHLLELEPNRVSALIGLANLRIALETEAAAVPCIRRAIDITGGDAETYLLLASALRASNDPLGAIDAYEKLFGVRDATREELIAAATLCMEEPVLQVEPDARQVGVRWLKRAIELDPQSTQAHFQLAVLHEELGDTDDAVVHYRRAVETDPACLMALTNLAILYASLGDHEHTAEIVGLALKLERDNSRRRALQRLLEPFESKQAGTTKPVQAP